MIELPLPKSPTHPGQDKSSFVSYSHNMYSIKISSLFYLSGSWLDLISIFL